MVSPSQWAIEQIFPLNKALIHSLWFPQINIFDPTSKQLGEGAHFCSGSRPYFISRRMAVGAV